MWGKKHSGSPWAAAYTEGTTVASHDRSASPASRPCRYVELVTCVMFAAAAGALAAPGDLDPTFGTGGVVTTDFGSTSDGAQSVAIQADGKIVAAGRTGIFALSDFALARYNTNGTLDTSFGTGGRVTTNLLGFDDSVAAVVIQPDGKIVVVGEVFGIGTDDFGLARYNPNGTLDTSFGTGGGVFTDFASGDDFGFAVALQTDGKIIAAGTAFNGATNDFALARYNANGTLDTSFGTGGIVTTDFASGGDSALGVAIQPDGRIVAVGLGGTGLLDFVLARYNANGTLDTSFGTGGLVTTDFSPGFGRAHAVAIQGDGKIVVAGASGGGITFTVGRYNSNGSIDTTFGTAGTGIVTTDFGFDLGESAEAVVLQADGKIVAAGAGVNFFASNGFLLARYNPNGSLDTSFGIGGQVSTGPDGLASSVALQADGKIVAAGTDLDDFVLVRYLGDGGGGGGGCPEDTDGDFIQESLEAPFGRFVDASTTPDTQGQIVSPGDQDLCITDAPGSDGVFAESLGGGSSPARFNVICSAGTASDFEVGSVIAPNCITMTCRTLSSGKVEAEVRNSCTMTEAGGTAAAEFAAPSDIEVDLLSDGIVVGTVVLPEPETLLYSQSTLEVSAPMSNSTTLIILTPSGDEIAIAPGQTAVLPPPLTIPAVSEWGVVILSLLLLTGITVQLTRRSATDEASSIPAADN